ncbi:SgcJ/EcaC family oxidoreductase [Actinoallomurus purpureus]|uniref:SgcJ/EcaC family oxidoreductase n=1 Tax=Actinoallomurus purpureus TaxID=478114 RepID=UPI0020939DDC|nr:SgcJ/EcaC family oxidoreductase [Actinoallomurus purpureus]MCO6010720.1 SgcJ/EcaC family oxidoreductase [Actinoallomurus purpureus]
MTDAEAVLRRVLDQWKAGVDDHDPHRVASHFTEDAIFQGSRPYSVGRQSVADYYDAQPLGLSVAYRIVESRRLSDDIVLGYVNANFSFTDRPTLSGYIGVVLKRSEDDWQISHYQVSGLG